MVAARITQERLWGFWRLARRALAARASTNSSRMQAPRGWPSANATSLACIASDSRNGVKQTSGSSGVIRGRPAPGARLFLLMLKLYHIFPVWQGFLLDSLLIM